jgi:hypothetical protein
MGSLGYNFQIGSHSGSEGVFPLGTMLPNFFNQAGKQAFKPNANFHLQFSKIEGENYPGTLASILKSANIIDEDGNIIDNPTQFGIGFHKAPPYLDPDTDDKYRAVTGWAAGQADSVSGPRKGWDKAEGWSSEGTLVYHIHCSNSKKSGRDWRFELLDKGRKIEFANQPGFYCAALQINGNWYKPDISLQAYKDGDIGNGWFALARCDSFYMYHVSDKYFDDARDRRCVKMCAPSGCLACMCAKPKFGCVTNHKLP